MKETDPELTRVYLVTFLDSEEKTFDNYGKSWTINEPKTIEDLPDWRQNMGKLFPDVSAKFWDFVVAGRDYILLYQAFLSSDNLTIVRSHEFRHLPVPVLEACVCTDLANSQPTLRRA